MRAYTLELLLFMLLMSLVLAGSDGPAGTMARESLLARNQETVIVPPNIPPIKEMDSTPNDSAGDKKAGIVPIRIHIPAVKIDAFIQPVGVLKNGAMGVPKDDTKVGWLHVGFKPGENGNAVMAGHVDNLQGVAVFHPLHEVQIGDEVIVSDKNGKQLTFNVTAIKTYRTEKAPIGYIFGEANKPKLNLITCTGYFDPKLRTHIDRLVVYSELKE